MDIRRYLEVKPLNWEALTQLPERLARHDISIESTSIDLRRYPTDVRFRAWDEAIRNVRSDGPPRHFGITLTGHRHEAYFLLSLRQYTNDFDDERYLTLEVNNVDDMSLVDDIGAFLGLAPDTVVDAPDDPPRTAFIAHRFDQNSEQLADRLARFLSLISFRVSTGRSFSPQSVSAKVRGRVVGQAVVFVILSAGEDMTWLTQESILAYARNKPLFILLEATVAFKSGVLGDHEYIHFVAPRIDVAFVPILEGLREIGYGFAGAFSSRGR